MVATKRPVQRTPLDSQESKRAKHGIADSDHSRRDARAAAVREGAQMKDWLSKEDDFVLKQAKKRSAIRVRESRAKPIDFLAVNLRFVDSERDPAEENELEEVEVRPKDPATYLPTLHPQELDELYDDLDEYYKLETNRSNKRYWRTLSTVCKALKKQSKQPSVAESRTMSTVGAEIEKILHGKTAEQLEMLEKSILKKLDSDQPIDVDYWEQLYQAVRLKQAWASLAHMFELIITAADEESKRKQIVFANGKRQITVAKPRYKLEDVDEKQTAVVRSNEKEFESAAARLYKQEANHELEEDEELFNREADIPAQTPKWQSKFPDVKPVKPKYFNRAQTGFEWNAYNKVHYDEEHLPPKVVSGYRFNIFYPDLLDKFKAPTYKIEKAPGRKSDTGVFEDMSIIRFCAGAPYEDVCFEIVDKDWDHSSRYDRGFKSSFDKGILQLHFKFKKVAYKK